MAEETKEKSEILRGKRGLILGALDERSLAWHVATRCVDEGANIVVSNTQYAAELGTIVQLAADRNMPFLVCDATREDEIAVLLTQTQQILGGKIDFVLHAVAQSQNLRRKKNYEQINYDYLIKTLDISAFSLHRLLRVAMEHDAIAQRGSVVALTYLASERYFCGYNDMADAKAMLESIVRQMGALYGKKCGVRVNAISQSAIQTKAGEQWNEQDFFYRYADDLSPIGSADADDCASLCVALFSDLTTKVTMQTIYNDGGFSRTMMTEKMVDHFRTSCLNTQMQNTNEK